MILEVRMRGSLPQQATTVATLSLRRFHRSDGLHRLNANSRDAGEERRFGSSEAVYRGRGSAYDFYGQFVYEKRKPCYGFPSRRTEPRVGLATGGWPGERQGNERFGRLAHNPRGEWRGKQIFLFFRL
jgi:hypothetical protein